jgi:predicted DCC family thiol-disulfide oxidoreductase YuxK
VATRTAPPPDGAPVVLYDGACALCTRQAGNLARLARGRVRAEALQTALPRFPGLSEAEALREIKLVAADGRVYGGADALVRLVNLGRPLLGKLLYPYYLPGVRQLADAAYGWVARNRYRLFGRADACEGGSCALHYESGGQSARSSERDV